MGKFVDLLCADQGDGLQLIRVVERCGGDGRCGRRSKDIGRESGVIVCKGIKVEPAMSKARD
jgi:hypothetical protein